MASPEYTTEQPAKKGVIGRWADSFKPPLDEKHAGTTVYVQDADAEKAGSSSSGTGAVDGDSSFDDSGLKRGLHGRHLQVSNNTTRCASRRRIYHET